MNFGRKRRRQPRQLPNIIFAAALFIAVRAAAQNTEINEASVLRECQEGGRLYEQKRYAEAEKRFTAATAELGKSNTASKVGAACFLLLADTQRKEGKYRESEAAARRAVEISEHYPGSTNLDVSYAMIPLGDVLEDEGKYSEAVSIVKRAWALRVGDWHDQTADFQSVTFRRQLGRLYRKNKEYDRAAELLQQNVSLLERPRITGHVEVVPALNDLAAVYIAQGKSAEAEALLHRALTLIDQWREEVRGDILLTTLDEYVELMQKTGRASMAKRFADRANTIRNGTRTQ